MPKFCTTPTLQNALSFFFQLNTESNISRQLLEGSFIYTCRNSCFRPTFREVPAPYRHGEVPQSPAPHRPQSKQKKQRKHQLTLGLSLLPPAEPALADACISNYIFPPVAAASGLTERTLLHSQLLIAWWRRLRPPPLTACQAYFSPGHL